VNTVPTTSGLPIEAGETLRWRIGEATPASAVVRAREGRRLELSLAARTPRLPADHTVLLEVERPDALYLLSARVDAQPSDRRLDLVISEANPERVQRREYFRLPFAASLLLARTPGHPAGSASSAPPLLDGGRFEAEFHLARVHDLSGGGCRVEGTQSWLGLDNVHAGFLYLGEGAPLALDLRTVRIERSPERTAFQFMGLPERKRERILRALFREHRRLRSTRLSN